MYHHLYNDTSTGHLRCGDEGHLSADCAPLPASCATDLPTRYRLLDVSPLSSCPLCTPASGNGELWDGSFAKTTATSCRWEPQNKDGYASAAGETLLIGVGTLASTFIEALLVDDPHWRLEIHCNSSLGLTLIWSGRKDVGQTPLGRYTRISGWLQTGTLTIH